MLAQGLRFTAKWSGMPILVEAQLGAGANGTVYRVRTRLGQAAMKVCSTSADVAMEWALLTSLGQAAPAFPKPMLIDDGPAEAPFFYVMEFIPGRPLDAVVKNGELELAMKAFEVIVAALSHLHQAGYAFCDLKPENVMVADEHDGSIRFVDVGGVTELGRSVRQYTPLCDRAFFGIGSRKADATYDLYALLLGLVTASSNANVNDLAKQDVADRQRNLYRILREFPVSGVVTLFDGLQGGSITTAKQFADAWNNLHPEAKHPQKPKNSQHPSSRHRRDWTEWIMWVSLGSAGVACIAAWGAVLGWLP